jgi:hypothetical protein
MILAYLLEILVFFDEFFLYFKLKWSSLGSLVGFSFCENLTMLKKKQEWQYQCQCFVPLQLQKMFSLCYVGPLPVRFFPQVLYMLQIMNLKKLRFVHFSKVTQTGVKGCWRYRAGSKKTLSSSFERYNSKIYMVKNSKKKSTYFHTNIRSYPMVEVLKKEIYLHGPFSVSMGVVFECFWRNIVKEL